jgi:replicative DNA helicase
MPHHLRESGNIEADADAIMLLWDPDGTKQIVKCKVAKNRQGAVGITDFAFRGEVTQFVQIDPRF